MNISWTRMTLFGAAGLLAIGLIAAYDPPPEQDLIDRHTGEWIDPLADPRSARVIRSTGDVIAETRALANAHGTLAALKAARSDLERADALLWAERILEDEIHSPQERTEWLVERDPAAAALVMERLADAAERRAAALSDPPEMPGLIAILRDLADDDAVAAAAERFYAALVAQRALPADEVISLASGDATPDHVAALAVTSLRHNNQKLRADVALLVAARMRANGRTRARLRWLLRGLEASPRSVELATALTDAYVEHGHLPEAFLVLTAAMRVGAADEPMRRRRVQLAQWMSRPDLEVVALEDLLGGNEDTAERQRLVDLYTFLGDSALALTHSIALAERDGSPQALARAALAATNAGRLARAIELFEDAAAAAEDPSPYEEQILALLFQDLRSDEMLARLRQMYDRDPTRYADRLIALARRLGDDALLADLLEAKLAVQPSRQLEDDVIALRLHLGQLDRVRAFETERIRRIDDPIEFFARFDAFLRLEIDGVRELAMTHVKNPALTAKDAYDIAAILSAHGDDPTLAAAFDELMRRFADDPAIQDLTLYRIDLVGNPNDVARAAEELSNRNPEHLRYARAWADRASWAGLLRDEIRARTRVRGLAPDDLENRAALANALEADRHLEEALAEWRVIAAAGDPDGTAEGRIVMLLTMLGREEELLAILDARVDRGGLSIDERAALADRFFAAERLDRASTLFESVLEARPDDAIALMRLGQIRNWAKNPEGAIPLFERLIEKHGPGDGEPPFLLGEAYAAVGRDEDARAMQEIAIVLLRDPERLTPFRESMAAKVLVHLGEAEEAAAIFRRLIAGNPTNHGLMIDFADSMLLAGRLSDARAALDMARPLAPDDRKFLRLDGNLAIAERRFEDAIVALRRGLELYGDDAGYFIDLGRALEGLGRWPEAYHAYAEAAELQPGNTDARFLRRRAGDLGGRDTLEFHVDSLSTDQDSRVGTRVEASTMLEDSVWRLTGLLGHTSYSGRARAVDDGLTDVTADVTHLGLGLSTSIARGALELGGGLDLYAGRDDAVPIGAWFGAARRWWDPETLVSARLHVNEVLEGAPAAVGLGGRSDGLSVEAYREMSEQVWWLSGIASAQMLSFEHPRFGVRRDTQVTVGATAGWWIDPLGPSLNDRLQPRRIPAASEGTTVVGEARMDDGLRIAVWGAYTGIHMLGGDEIAGPLPLGNDFDYLTANGRIEGSLARQLIYSVRGSMGVEMQSGSPITELEIGLGWRPRETLEVRLGVQVGRVLSRLEDDTSARVQLAVVWEW